MGSPCKGCSSGTISHPASPRTRIFPPQGDFSPIPAPTNVPNILAAAAAANLCSFFPLQKSARHRLAARWPHLFSLTAICKEVQDEDISLLQCKIYDTAFWQLQSPSLSISHLCLWMKEHRRFRHQHMVRVYGKDTVCSRANQSDQVDALL